MSFSIDIQSPPGWDDIAAGKQGNVLVGHFVPQVPPSSSSPVFSASQREEEESDNQPEVRGPKTEKGEQALGLVGTKVQQPCLLELPTIISPRGPHWKPCRRAFS